MVVAGCGNDRTKPPSVGVPRPPEGLDTKTYGTFGFTIGVPHAWHLTTGTAPLLLTAQSGSATIALWRYPRTERHLPSSHAALVRALRSLLRAVRRRDPTFVLDHARVGPVAHRGALEIVGTETIDGVRRRVRSTHMFVRHAEVVVDAYAPAGVFAAVDRVAFVRVVHSLRAGRVA